MFWQRFALFYMVVALLQQPSQIKGELQGREPYPVEVVIANAVLNVPMIIYLIWFLWTH